MAQGSNMDMDWTCGQCTFINKPERRKCEMCKARQSDQDGDSAADTTKHEDVAQDDVSSRSHYTSRHHHHGSGSYRGHGRRHGHGHGHRHESGQWRGRSHHSASRGHRDDEGWREQTRGYTDHPGHLAEYDGINASERRLVLIGRTGSGKSATGNNILSKQVFESSTCGSSVTKKCQRGTGSRFGQNIEIIDSPGLFDTGMTNADITREVVKCVGMTAPGPHAFVLVVRIDRFTQEEQDTVEHFKKVFGEGMLNYLVVLFTRKDDIVHDGLSLQQYIEKVPVQLKQLLKSCHKRCVAFNNRGTPEERDADVKMFLDLVDSIYQHNGGHVYTSEMYAEAEKTMKAREEQLRREHRQKVQRERDAVKREYEKKLQKAKRGQDEVKHQMEARIKQLEKDQRSKQSDAEKGREGAVDEVKSLTKDLEELKLTMKEMKKESESDARRLRREVEEREEDLRRRERPNFRDQAREEVHREEPGVLEKLGSGIKGVVNFVGGLFKKLF